MSEYEHDGQEQEHGRVLGEGGIVSALGSLPPGAVIEEVALAKMFGRHVASIKRAVQRGELPPATRLFGRPAWTAESILRHISKRLDAALVEAEKDSARIGRLSP